jgi:hypothetical protein
MLRATTAIVAATSAMLLFAVPASAGHDQNPSPKVDRYTFDVDPVPHPATKENDGVEGTVRFTALPNGQVQVKVRLSGLAPNLPHAQHIHGEPLGNNFCPDASVADDIIDDGLIDGVEATPAYGAIQVALTTTGDTSPASSLAVARFPVADDNGNLSYNRTIDVPDAIYENLGGLHYVVHGIDLNESGGYDFVPFGPSPLDGSLPFEATIPAGCAGQST